MDNTDLRILAQLQTDASLTNQELAERVHVSPATCLRRVKRLEEAGIIERRVAILSPEKLGAGLTAIIEVTLDQQAAERLAAFETRAAADAAVQQCYRVSSGPDFVLILQVRDMEAYNQTAQRLFAADANVRNVRAFFSVHRAKFGTQITLAPPA
ncbi:Lrp/AsnC family transcriptional regulator [Uliginosibacterium sp. 31-16]|uniref:Lrp/AsnC family transcriptional regulator n=1 Tax=Uliginosibacterium sp. 31-16 TaxID=3068315 RepID=UPI00273CFA5F|nr:Lrp/AsnC family transcriptional regulator [Uliginosibacterium sp. 31-16]MDP5241100.1 Lrp/AsnC family transcriptional regulator [Uliginosibacterium sp. 31-16]